MRKGFQLLAVASFAALSFVLTSTFKSLHLDQLSLRLKSNKVASDSPRFVPPSAANGTDVGLSSVDDFVAKLRSRMEERKNLLLENCKKLGLHHNMSAIREDLMYSTKYKTIFCQIPKTGITNWKHLFTDMIGVTINGGNFSAKFKRMYQSKQNEKVSLLLKKDWFKMTVVREPMERLVSAYRSKLEGSGTTMWSVAKRIQIEYGDKNDPDFASRKIPDFNTFINYLVLNYPDSMHTDNRHWETYSSLCQPCDYDYDVIGHQETIVEDSEYVLRMIGASLDLTLMPPYRNKTDDDMVLRYYSSVKPRDRVLQLYNLLLEDYLLFGYPPPPLLGQLFGKN